MNKKPGWAYKYPDRWERIVYNKDYLKSVEDDCGDLYCEYCGKEELVIYEWYEDLNKSDVATVDHFYPKSKYRHLERDTDNFIVSCYDCNNKKKDDIWLVEEIEFPKDRSQIDILKNKWQKMILNG